MIKIIILNLSKKYAIFILFEKKKKKVKFKRKIQKKKKKFKYWKIKLIKKETIKKEENRVSIKNKFTLVILILDCCHFA